MGKNISAKNASSLL